MDSETAVRRKSFTKKELSESTKLLLKYKPGEYTLPPKGLSRARPSGEPQHSKQSSKQRMLRPAPLPATAVTGETQKSPKRVAQSGQGPRASQSLSLKVRANSRLPDIAELNQKTSDEDTKPKSSKVDFPDLGQVDRLAFPEV